MRKFNKVSKQEWFKFDEKGDVVEGIVKSIQSGAGEFGEYEYLVIDVNPDGLPKFVNVQISSALKGYDWDDWKENGNYVRIIYTGEQKNQKTRRTFKAFEVLVAE